MGERIAQSRGWAHEEVYPAIIESIDSFIRILKSHIKITGVEFCAGNLPGFPVHQKFFIAEASALRLRGLLDAYPELWDREDYEYHEEGVGFHSESNPEFDLDLHWFNEVFTGILASWGVGLNRASPKGK